MEFKWKEKKVSEIGNIVTGKTPSTKREKNFGGRVPFLTPSDDMNARYVYETKRHLSDEGVNEVRKKLIPKNSICISCIGSQLGKVTITTEETVTNQQINSIIINDEYNIKFIYYLFLILGQKLNFLSKSSTAVPIINKKFFSEIVVKVPQRQLQDKTAILLDSLDSKIEINNKIISNLESQAQAIFKSWFVDFEPFQDGDFVESELGMIPKGWEVKELGELYPMKSGYAFKSKDWSDNGFPIIKIKNISNGSIDLSNVDYVNCKETLKKAISFKVTGGEIVMALTGATTGKFGVIPYNTSAYINQRAGLFFDKQEIGYGFLYGLLKQKKIINNIIELSQGSAQENLSPRDVNSLKIAFYKNITDIFNLLNYYIKKVSELKFQNTKLAELRDALLPKLMAGEIDVSNIKIEGKEVKNE